MNTGVTAYHREMGRGLLALAVLAACAKGDAPTVDSGDPPCEMRTFFLDGDGDMHGDPEMPIAACERPPGTVDAGDDCDDRDANRAPGLAELCDTLDNDCNPATAEVCPAGCMPIRRPPPDDTKVYLFCLNPASWNGAQAVCVSAMSALVQIDDDAENAFVRATANQLLGANDVHIGASDLAVEGAWLWQSGTQFWSGGPGGAPTMGRYANWRGGEPNNDSNEDCGEMKPDATWNDGNCGDGQRFVCRR
jgi:hypothetical protein